MPNISTASANTSSIPSLPTLPSHLHEINDSCATIAALQKVQNQSATLSPAVTKNGRETRVAHTQILLLPKFNTKKFLAEVNPKLATDLTCSQINSQKVLTEDAISKNTKIETSFKGYQKINQVLRWISSTALVANAYLDLENGKIPPNRDTPEVQATIFPSGEIILGSNAVDTKVIPQLLSRLINNKEGSFEAVAKKMREDISNDQSNSNEKSAAKRQQRLQHMQSLREFVTNDELANQFITDGVDECPGDFEKIITRSYLLDIRRAIQEPKDIKMVAPPKGLELAHAEQRIFEFAQQSQFYLPFKIAIDKWAGSFSQKERAIMSEEKILPLFIAGTKPPCSSCSNLESERAEYAIKNGPSIIIYGVRAEDSIETADNGSTPAVGELFPNTHITKRLLDDPVAALPPALPNTVAYIRNTSSNHSLKM